MLNDKFLDLSIATRIKDLKKLITNTGTGV